MYAMQVYAANAYYNLQIRIQNDNDATQNEINRLRTLGDPDSQRRADILRQRLESANGVAGAVSAPSFTPDGGNANLNQGRPVSGSTG